MHRKRSAAPLLLVAACAACAPAAGAGGPHAEQRARVQVNDNREPAGTLRGGTLRLHLQAREAEWYLLGDGEEAGVVAAFAEAGRAPQIPGPLIRVPVNTEVHAVIENLTDSTLVVHGLSARRQSVLDSVVVPPRGRVAHRFTADVEGTYYYWGTTSGAPLNRRTFEDSQLGGALIIDPVGGSLADRVLVIGMWVEDRLPSGSPDFNTEYTVVNGRPWPFTERFEYDVGDSIRWRVINASFDVHPLHLHGFYYRVDARGDIARDSIFWPAQRRMAVTERMSSGQTMTMTWSPDRPGTWLLHCHLTFHVAPNPGRGVAREDSAARYNTVVLGHPHHEPHDHVEKGMGGLMVAASVAPPPGWRFDEPAHRQLRLYINSDSVAGSPRRFAYVLMESDTPPAPDSLLLPGSTLVLRRGEPTSVRVINQSTEPTQIHWHGLELQSYYDGVVGIGGHPGMRTPAIMPGDSFEMRITPPRAGSFMYHTHMNDIQQQTLGLYGPIVILEPDEEWDPERDIILLLGTVRTPGFGTWLNGRAEHPTRTLHVGETYRLRLMNITVSAPSPRMRLMRDGGPELWTAHAKDGHDLPAYLRRPVSAELQVTIGETYDFLYTPRSAGEVTFEVRTAAYRPVGEQRFRVLPRTQQ
jgi:manganese oxidase